MSVKHSRQAGLSFYQVGQKVCGPRKSSAANVEAHVTTVVRDGDDEQTVVGGAFISERRRQPIWKLVCAPVARVQ